MDKFTIVSITPEHIEGYRDAVGSVAREGKYLAFLDAPPLQMSCAFVLDNIKVCNPHFVALMDDKVVGWCDISSHHRPVLEHSGTLGMGVIDGYRKLAIGEALIKATLAAAKAKGLTRIDLTVREHNTPAIALYKKHGFKTEGLHPNAIKIGEQYENQLSMGLLI